jgi:hypothetical protein
MHAEDTEINTIYSIFFFLKGDGHCACQDLGPTLI